MAYSFTRQDVTFPSLNIDTGRVTLKTGLFSGVAVCSARVGGSEMWNSIGCALVWPNGKAYFLRGNEYVRYDIKADRPDSGYPLPIAGNWKGLSLSRVDAALVWP